jgi:hypothetical protein
VRWPACLGAIVPHEVELAVTDAVDLAQFIARQHARQPVGAIGGNLYLYRSAF